MPAATSEDIAALTSSTVVVHPLVLLSVVDHAARAARGTKRRVVGILLGQNDGKKINVANSFAVPFEEDERDPRTWFLDHNFIEEMQTMFKKVSAKERVIGWYHTGPRLRASDLQINEVIKRFTPKPVMVIIDPRQRDSGIPTDAYFAVEEIKDDGTATQKTFMHVPSTIEAEEAEEIGVMHLLRDIKNLSTGTLSARVADRLTSLKGLASHLAEIRDYLTSVVAGEMPVNHQIIYNLQDIFNLLPTLEGLEKSSDGKRPFTVATNDELLVLYLSSMIRSVIALHNLVNNKLENTNADNGIEDEEETKKEKKDGEDDKKKDEKEKDAKKSDKASK
ncbi:26S proteasome regulatory subunit N8 [Cystobasidium minutum MCA 4210]|uniref:26S proteasome regulatory subunit N8 n=1 Tax=Cystobasidium minutum MCA 4210 TaxID=1397322 RepID=UPI0034CDA4BA|eukprot:jgi/Rhomi1/67648/CE67647_2951